MAYLTEEPYPIPEYDADEYDSYHPDYTDDEEEAFDELLDDPDEDLVSFPVADGSAVYRVVELDGPEGEPLLQHVPFGDAYAIPAAHVRGLRREDIERRLESPFH